MNVRLALLYEVHGGGDIVDLFTGISPHQEHTHLNSIALRRIGGPDYLIDFDAPLHSVEDALANAPFDDVIYAIQFVDSRSADGWYRKYRVVFVDRVPYPYHLAISDDWLVHYWTAHMGRDAAKRAEEAAFLENPAQAIGERGMAALHAIGAALDLDYAGIDFGIGPAGELLLFEANATMVIAPPDPDERWEYRRAAIGKILDAVVAMIMQKSVGASRA